VGERGREGEAREKRVRREGKEERRGEGERHRDMRGRSLYTVHQG